jgi:hypothetical protein
MCQLPDVFLNVLSLNTTAGRRGKAEDRLEVFLSLITASHFVFFAPTKKMLPVLIKKDAEWTPKSI